MTIIQQFQVVIAHHLMLYYNQMLSNLNRRCQGKCTLELRLTVGLELGLSSCSWLLLQPRPSQDGADTDPLTVLTLGKAAFLVTFCFFIRTRYVWERHP